MLISELEKISIYIPSDKSYDKDGIKHKNQDKRDSLKGSKGLLRKKQRGTNNKVQKEELEREIKEIDQEFQELEYDVTDYKYKRMGVFNENTSNSSLSKAFNKRLKQICSILKKSSNFLTSVDTDLSRNSDVERSIFFLLFTFFNCYELIKYDGNSKFLFRTHFEEVEFEVGVEGFVKAELFEQEAKEIEMDRAYFDLILDGLNDLYEKKAEGIGVILQSCNDSLQKNACKFNIPDEYSALVFSGEPTEINEYLKELTESDYRMMYGIVLQLFDLKLSTEARQSLLANSHLVEEYNVSLALNTRFTRDKLKVEMDKYVERKIMDMKTIDFLEAVDALDSYYQVRGEEQLKRLFGTTDINS